MNKLPLFLLGSCAFNAVHAQRWNIVYIMSDDHSYQAISAYGHQLSKQAPTPNLDRLAERLTAQLMRMLLSSVNTCNKLDIRLV